MATLTNKWKASHDSNRTYRSKWEETFVWVQKAAGGSEAAYCKLCHCNILTRINNLSNHEKLEKHKRRTQLQGQTRLKHKKAHRQDMDKFKAVELQIAVSMTCHFAICTVDHLSEIMIAHGHGSRLEHIIRRSMCARLSRNIISPALKADLTDTFRTRNMPSF
jgi:hypothetical protein